MNDPTVKHRGSFSSGEKSIFNLLQSEWRQDERVAVHRHTYDHESHEDETKQNREIWEDGEELTPVVQVVLDLFKDSHLSDNAKVRIAILKELFILSFFLFLFQSL